MIKINFGHPNDKLKDIGFIDMPIHADLTQSLDVLSKKISDLIVANFPDIVKGGNVSVTLPGASLLVAACLTAIHGLTGNFPVVVPVLRNADGTFNPVDGVDLQKVRTDIRSTRAGVNI
jgi:hypothetical protein